MNRQPGDTPELQSAASTRSTRVYTAIGVAFGLVFPIIATVMKALELKLPLTLPNLMAVQGLDPVLLITDTAPVVLGIFAGIAGRRQDIAVQANQKLKERERDLTAIRANLEDSVIVRTRELDQRNAEMRSVVTFARQIAEIQDLPALLSASVEILHERFAQYDVNLFLVDDTGQSAVLRASSTTGGKGMVQSGYRVSVGDQSVIGRVARRGKLMMATVRPEPTEAGHAAPAATTVNQVALPLVVHGSVIGVLDMLPQNPMPISQPEADILQLLADQLAASIQSARLATEAHSTVQQLQAVTAEGTRSLWRKYLADSSRAYQFTPGGVRAIPADQATGGLDALRMPIILRGQRIGSIAIRRKSGGTWSAGEQDLIEKVAAQVGLALDNVRLLEETKQQAAEEQIISEISARFSRSLDVDALLQAAAREFAALPDVAEATVLLKPTDDVELHTAN